MSDRADPAWQLLGIEPTADAAAIRRAYAARLKEIDVDAEPARFVALRNAYDEIRTAPLIEHASAERLAPEQAGGADRDAMVAISGRMADLLESDRNDIDDELADLTLRLTAEIDRETIDRQVEWEERLADTIADHLPRSDAMIRPAIAAFRWHLRRAGQYRPERAYKAVERMRELSFTEFTMLRESGRHHRAWLALQAPPASGFFRIPDFAALDALDRFFVEVGTVSALAGVSIDRRIVAAWYHELHRHELALGRWRNGNRSFWFNRVLAWLLVAGLVVFACITALGLIRARPY